MRNLFGAGRHPLAEQLRGGRCRGRPRRAATRTQAALAREPRSRSTPTTSPRSGARSPRRVAALNVATGPARGRARRSLRGPGPDPHRGRRRAVPRRARPRPRRRPRARRDDRQALPAADHRGRRLRPDLLPGQVASARCGRSPTRRSPPRSNAPTRPAVADALAFLERPRPVHPAGHQRGPPGRRPAAWSRPRSPTATPAPATPTCTPTSPSPTRSRPGRRAVAGDRRAGAVQGHRRRLRDLQHRASSGTCATPSACGSTPAPTPTPASVRSARSSASTPRWQRAGPPRRASIEARRSVLAAEFQATHGRPPTPIESIQLAQQATLETREAKHEPRSLAEQRAAWARAGRRGPRRRPGRARRCSPASLAPARRDRRPGRRGLGPQPPRPRSLTTVAGRPVALAGLARPAPRPCARSATADLPSRPTSTAVVGLLVDEVLTDHSVALTRPGDDIDEPAAAAPQRTASSVYTVAGSTLFTSPASSPPRHRIVARAGQRDGHARPRAGRRPRPARAGRQRASPSTPDRPPWSARWPPPAPGCSWRSPPPGPARPPPCAPSPPPGPTPAATVLGLAPSAAAAERRSASSIGAAHRHPGQADLAPRPPHARRPARTGRSGSARPPWWSSTRPAWPTPSPWTRVIEYVPRPRRRRSG